jgi:hypothetical protein
MPDLTLHEQAALMVFLDCEQADQWNYIGGDMSPARKVALKVEAIEFYAKSYGIPCTPGFNARLTACVRQFLEYDARRLAAEEQNRKFADEGAVN